MDLKKKAAAMETTTPTASSMMEMMMQRNDCLRMRTEMLRKAELKILARHENRSQGPLRMEPFELPILLGRDELGDFGAIRSTCRDNFTLMYR